MTQAQLKSFQKSLGSTQKVERIVSEHEPKIEYLLVWFVLNDKKYKLDFVFILYNNTLLHRIEIDGYLRSYVLNALEKTLKE